MALITRFDDLSDLFLIDLFTYLSSIDVLWSFIHLNSRLQSLIIERGFFHRINLSSARLSQFNTLLSLLPLDQIETLVIDIEASSFQLSRWPYLPHLTTLQLHGLHNFEDASNFILRHATSLRHLKCKTSDLFMSLGFTGHTVRPTGRLATLVENVLPHLTMLRSLNLGQDIGLGLPRWRITTIHSHLTYLCLPVQSVNQLCQIMSTEKLSTTLEQFHATMRSEHITRFQSLSKELILPKMLYLHTFTLVQSIFSTSRIDWPTIESLTSVRVMPLLRRVNLAIFVKIDDLVHFNRSPLFTDDRRIDVQFAFIVDDVPLGIQLMSHIPHGSSFYPRQIVGVTLVRSRLSLNHQTLTNNNDYFDSYSLSYDVWYTLPWKFEQFFDLVQPTQHITKIEVFALPPLYSHRTYSSRLRTLSVSQNKFLPSIISMPQVVQLDRVHTVHLAFHDWPTSLNLLALHHVTLTNNLVLLKSFASFPTGIRSIRILLHANMPNFTSTNWCTLYSLSALSMLTSLSIVLNDSTTGLDDTTCQIIADIVPTVVNFGIFFRNKTGKSRPKCSDRPVHLDPNNLVNILIDDDDNDDSLPDSVFDDYQTSIEKLHHLILRLPFDMKPLIVVEEEGCGLTVWL